MAQRIIVTAGLPYANGSLHLGHLVEYSQADMYVRALRALGEDALYICGADTHGTPIQVNAEKQGIPPLELALRYHREHQRDFARYDIHFDHYSHSHSEANRSLVDDIYRKLCDGGHIYTRDIEGMWDEAAKRFLPDRFIRGTCPVCHTPDQYGDVCENCRSTYTPRDLIEPRSVLSGESPVPRSTKHVFFRLSSDENVQFLRRWTESGALPRDTLNYVRSWLDEGLKDWDISRDAPYFGFEIPDEPGQFFYVWFDAPLCYAATSAEWGEKHGVSFDNLWRNPKATAIEHVIGKDIVYFHTLFWPAVLNAVGMTLPRRVHVHGMLTVDGVKMSKSRGTFIRAEVFANHIDPQALRFYLASKYGSGSEDLDLSLDDFVTRINAELVNKHANLFSRAAQFLHRNLDNRLGDLPFSPDDAQVEAEPQASTAHGPLIDLARRVIAHARRVETLYRAREFALAMRELAAIADIGNETMQARKPWDEIKNDREAARLTITFALNVCHALAMYLSPIVPRFADAGARILGVKLNGIDSTALFSLRNRKIGAMERLFERITPKTMVRIVEASKENLPDAEASAASAATRGSSKPGARQKAGAQIALDDFKRLELRVGRIDSVQAVPKSDRLLKLIIELGEERPRQIISGIAERYAPQELVGAHVVVVANLPVAKIRGVESQGMILAAGDGKELEIVRVGSSLPPGTPVH